MAADEKVASEAAAEADGIKKDGYQGESRWFGADVVKDAAMSMVISCNIHGDFDFMVIYGDFMVILWWFYGDFMESHGDFRVISMCFFLDGEWRFDGGWWFLRNRDEDLGFLPVKVWKNDQLPGYPWGHKRPRIDSSIDSKLFFLKCF